MKFVSGVLTEMQRLFYAIIFNLANLFLLSELNSDTAKINDNQILKSLML